MLDHKDVQLRFLIVFPACLQVSTIEPVLVQVLGSEFAVEQLDKRVISGFAGPTEVQFDLVEVRPLIHRLRGELTAVIDLDRFRLAPTIEQPIQDGYHVIAFDALADMQSQALTTEEIDYR